MASASDDFNRADNASVGANWTQDSGTWGINTNRAVQTNTTNNARKCRYTATAPATNDNYSEVIARAPTGAAQGAGAFVRGANSATVTMYTISIYGGDFCYLSEWTAGVEAVIDTGSAITAGTDYTLRLTASGTSLTGTLDSVTDVTGTDGTLTNGGWGMMSYDGLASGITQSWDSWNAADLTSGAVPHRRRPYRFFTWRG